MASYVAHGIPGTHRRAGNRRPLSELKTMVGRKKLRAGRPSKITDDGVRIIRRLFDAGMPYRAIAASFGVAADTIRQIGARENRTGVPD